MQLSSCANVARNVAECVRAFIIEIWIHSTDACILAMSCVGYASAWLKTLSSLLNCDLSVINQYFSVEPNLILNCTRQFKSSSL